MVDPVEAKRLAAKQMEAIKAKQSFQVIFCNYYTQYTVYSTQYTVMF